MGIPLYFKYLRQTYPHLIERVNLLQSNGDTSAPVLKCDHFYLDFNCAVHRCAAQAMQRQEKNGGVRAVNDHSDRRDTRYDQETLVIDATWEFLEELVDAVRPRKSLFVAIDGVPPRSKMVQQRNRRYLSDWGKRVAVSSGGGARDDGAGSMERMRHDDTTMHTATPPPWDSNSITPGTPFMARLAADLRARMEAKKAGSWRHIGVELSDAGQQWEGEQKIYARIRSTQSSPSFSNKTEDRPSESRRRESRSSRSSRSSAARPEPTDVHVVYGLDADLLVLSALCQGHAIRVLRPVDGFELEKDLHKGMTERAALFSYYCVDVSAFRGVIHAMIRCSSEEESVREYAVLCSLMGNDFVPSLSCLSVSNETVKDLVSLYHRVKREIREAICGASVLTHETHEYNATGDEDIAALVSRDCFRNGGDDARYRLNCEFLRCLFEKLASEEDARMRDVDAGYYAMCRSKRERAGHRGRPHRHRKGHDDENEIDAYPLLHPFPDLIRPGETGWRLRYYRHLFGPDQQAVIERACRNYIEGLQWSINYHCQQGVDDAWYYRYPYSPTVLDLANYLALNSSRIMREPIPEVRSHGMNPEMQMLMVLPPSSIVDMLPPEYADVATNVDRGCAQFYPRDFRVLTYLRRYLSDCVPVLPDIDENRVGEQYYSIRRKRNARERRSRIGQGHTPVQRKTPIVSSPGQDQKDRFDHQ